MSLVIKPPDPFRDAIKDKKSLFLAGSIEGGTATDWQEKVASALSEYDIVILNPRRDHWDATWKQSIDNPKFREQVEWELDAQDACDAIFMYFDKNTKSPITLLELGLFASSGKIIVSCPDEFWRKGNVEIVCDRYKIPLVDSGKDLIGHLKEKLNL